MTDTAHAQAFWANHPVDPGWVAHYRNDGSAPHRAWVIEALREAQPWQTVFEVGCHCGPMLTRIQQAFPEAKVAGCDVSAQAVRDARQRGLSVLYRPFPAATTHWPDRSVDVVLSVYTFAYFDPLDVEVALMEAGRIARRGVILAEPVAWDLGQVDAIDRGGFSEWKHPYLALLTRCPVFHGWTAHCREVEYQRMSGILRIMRP